MADDTTRLIKDRLPIEEVVGSYVQLRPFGKVLKARCPFHDERTPSFVVTPDRAMYHCFGCNRGGDIFSFVQEIERLSFREALQLLAARAGVSLGESSEDTKAERHRARLRALLTDAAKFYQITIRKTPAPVEYLVSRGLTKETIVAFGIGYAPSGWSGATDTLRTRGYSESELIDAGISIRGNKGLFDRFRERIMFPISDHQARIVGFSGRVLPGTELAKRDDVGKYVNSPETELFHKTSVLYGFDRARQAIAREGACVLVEGQLDVVLAHQAGTQHVVALSGTACTPEHCALIGRFTDTLVLALDQDKAGLRAALRSASVAYEAGLEVDALLLPAGSDPADIIRDNPDVWKEILSKRRDVVAVQAEHIRDTMNDPRARLRALRLDLFPLLARVPRELSRDQKLRSLAHVLDISIDALRKDFQTFVEGETGAPRPKPAGAGGAAEQKEKAPALRTTHDVIEEQIVGILIASKDLKLAEQARTKMDALLGVGSYDRVRAQYAGSEPRLATESDLVYREATTEKYTQVLNELFLRYELILAQRESEALLAQVRHAERTGDTATAQTLLRTVHELSERIDSLRRSAI